MKKRYLPVVLATGLALLASPLAAFADTGTLSMSGQAPKTSTNKSPASILSTSATNQTVYSGSAEVDITNSMDFAPNVIYVTPGTTVTWKNTDNAPDPHTVKSDTGLFQSDFLFYGDTFSYTFDHSGTYDYSCTVHPDMTGTVIVTDSTSGLGTTGSTTNSSSSSNNNSSSTGSTSTTNNATPAYSIAPLGTGTAGEPKQADDTYLLPYTMENGYKVFHLDAKPVYWQVKPGQIEEAWAYNGSVPGPEIKVDQGDKVKIIVKNDLPEGTTVHWHGLDVPFAQEGTGGVAQPNIAPGQSWTYTFKVNATPGTYIYHSHPMGDMLKQEEMGLFAPFVVEPKGTGWQQVHPGFQKEYTLFLNDSPEFGYTINGLSYPATPIMPVTLGDKVLVHLINIGSMSHSMHLHGMRFQEIEQDGALIPQPISMKTLAIAPGQTFDFTFEADSVGKWLYHCHMTDHVVDSNGNMSGLVTMFDVTQPKEQDYADYQADQYWSYPMLWGMNNNILKGYQNTNKLTALKPFNTATEAQALTVLYRYFNPKSFSTAATPSWWAQIPYQLASKDGLPVKKSNANSKMTRGHFAVLLASLYYGHTVDTKTAVQFMYDADLSSGYPDSSGQSPKTYASYGVNKLVTRGQMMTFLEKVDNYKTTHPATNPYS